MKRNNFNFIFKVIDYLNKRFISILFLASSFSLFFVIGGYVFFIFLNSPHTDLFCVKYLGETKGVITYCLEFYNKWSGRTFNQLFRIVLLSFFTPKSFSVFISLLSFVSIIISWIYIIRFFIQKLPYKEAILFSCLLTILSFVGQDIVELLYWETVAMGFVLPCVFFNISLIACIQKLQKPLPVASMLLIFISTWICTGSSESFTLPFILMMGIFNILFFKKEKRMSYFLLCSFITSLIFGAISTLAPGNFVRQDVILNETKHYFNFFEIISINLIATMELIFRYLSYLGLYIVTFICLFFKTRFNLYQLSNKTIWYVFSFFIVAIYFSQLPGTVNGCKYLDFQMDKKKNDN